MQLALPTAGRLSDDQLFDALDALVDEEAMAAYGVSVETVAEGPTALAVTERAEDPGDPGRLPAQAAGGAAAGRRGAPGSAILARVPLASGLLSGRVRRVDTTFAADDHRTFNRNGEAFDVGETFAGVPFDVGVAAAREVAEIAGDRRPRRRRSRCAG